MSRAVFTQTDGVVGVNKDTALLHQRRHTYRVAGVFHEHQEGRAVVDKTTVQGNAVHHGRHTEFTHPVVQVVATGIVGFNRLGTLPPRKVGARQISRATEQFWQHLAVGIQTQLRRFAGGDFLTLVLALGNKGIGLLGKVGGQVTAQAALKFSGQLWVGSLVGGKLFIPRLLGSGAALASAPGTVDILRHLKAAVGPVKRFASQGNFVIAQRRAVALFFALLIGRALTNDRFAADQCGLVRLGATRLNGGGNGIAVVTVDRWDHLPAVGFKAFGSIVAEPAFHFTVDGNAIVVVESDQFAQAQGTGQ